MSLMQLILKSKTFTQNNIILCKEVESDHENILHPKRFSDCLEAKYLIKS